MKGIAGLKKSSSNSYADTARQHSEKEKEALDAKLLEQQLEQKNMQERMIALATAQEAEMANAVVAKATTVEATTANHTAQEVTTAAADADFTKEDKAGSMDIQVEKPKPAKQNPSVKAPSNNAVAYFNENNVVQFTEAFQIKQAKRADFKPFSFSAPQDIALEVKTKAMRDNLNMCELNNLLYVLYCEKGLPKELLERYRKATSAK